ncbi:DUF2934 domain-containing protein [Agrobacterium sp. FDAARGOS_525]|jgi:Protein of unknown function (DUF2934)|uniref:DUF2934 domain-containing protein n=1 Tax=Agrobacterium sp. FDAARGOS_525 TaxID=2420311 RepID=UPI000F686D7A|nr:DUF2934 domain-containing protein [Agrobacterium sp. FDAARGOS_525]RSC21419.1 DUF2934 domain-containing protein [Agrobacterium sp. FDAARGOS_525]
MHDLDENWIRNRAYEIWEAEGHPEGRDLDHWLQAASDYLAKEGEAPADLTVAIDGTGAEPKAPVKKRSRSVGNAKG